MNFDQLKSFHKVAQLGSFTRAAGELFITQPAVSQQIRILEHTLGSKLFDRSGKKIFLTSEGEILLSYTKQFFELYDEIINVFSLQQSLEKGKINIASTRVLGTYYLPKIIGMYNRLYPGIEIGLLLGNSHRIMDIMLKGEIDFGFAGKIRHNPSLASIPIHQEKLIILSSSKHYLATKKTVTVNDLVKTPFIWREKGTQTQKVVKKWMTENIGGKFPKQSIVLENVEATKKIVEEGYGVTIMPETAVKKEIESGLLKPIRIDGFDLLVDFYLLHFKGKVFSNAAREFLKILYNAHLLTHSDNLKDIINDPL